MKRLAPFPLAIALVTGGLLCATANAQVVTPKYVINALGNLSGQAGGSVQANAINEAGQVVGSSANADGKTRAFRTAPNRAIKPSDDIGTLGGDTSVAYGINNNGQVVGDADTAVIGPFNSVVRRAFRLDPGAAMIDLGTLAPNGGVNGFNTSGARGINDAGQVVGLATVPADGCGSVSHAFRTSPNATIAPVGGNDLGTLVPPPYVNCRSSIAFGINSGGAAVGNSATVVSTGSPYHAFRTAPLVYRIDLNMFGWGESTAYAINGIGETVGQAQMSIGTSPFDPSPHAFLSVGDITHKSIDLGTLGGTYSVAYGINTRYPADSQVVGSSSTSTDPATNVLHGFIWTGNIVYGGTMVDLNSRIDAASGWEIVDARAINNRGQIVVHGRRTGEPFVYYALRLDPSDVAVDVVIASLSDPAYGLTGGQINALTDKLKNAITSIQLGLFKQAVNQLNAAISSIQVAVSGGRMSVATGNALTATINAIIATVS
jgi:probable HAF family extracellular repeat protein